MTSGWRGIKALIEIDGKSYVLHAGDDYALEDGDPMKQVPITITTVREDE